MKMKLTFNKILVGFLFAFAFTMFLPMYHADAVLIDMITLDDDASTPFDNSIKATLDINKNVFAPGETMSITASAYYDACSNTIRSIEGNVYMPDYGTRLILNGTVGGGTRLYGNENIPVPTTPGNYRLAFNVLVKDPTTNAVVASAAYLMSFSVVALEPLTSEMHVIVDGVDYEGDFTVPAGKDAKVWWTSTNADTCSAKAFDSETVSIEDAEFSNEKGRIKDDAEEFGNLQYDTTFSLTCDRDTTSSTTDTTDTPTPTSDISGGGPIDTIEFNNDYMTDL